MSGFEGFPGDTFAGRRVYHGKVREVIDNGDQLLLVTTDRISAFDRPLGSLAGKGEILNQMALWWFRQTSDLIANHIVAEVSPRAVAVKKAKVVPVEVVVRAYLTGSAWKSYSAGQTLPGLEVPGFGDSKALHIHQKLPQPMITPTTKEAVGEHDLPISRADLVSSGRVTAQLWAQIEQAALALFHRGTEVLAQRGLILVDTKYEFGLVDEELLIVDEMHTPDCSRFWFAEDYSLAISAGSEPRKLDKEYLRQWLAGQGFTGNGEVPSIPAEVFARTLARYSQAYQLITGQKWVPSGLDSQAETSRLLSYLS